MLAIMERGNPFAHNEIVVMPEFFESSNIRVMSSEISSSFTSVVKLLTVTKNLNNISQVGVTESVTTLPDPVFNYDFSELEMAMNSAKIIIPDEIEDFDYFERWLEQFK